MSNDPALQPGDLRHCPPCRQWHALAGAVTAEHGVRALDVVFCVSEGPIFRRRYRWTREICHQARGREGARVMDDSDFDEGPEFLRSGWRERFRPGETEFMRPEKREMRSTVRVVVKRLRTTDGKRRRFGDRSGLRRDGNQRGVPSHSELEPNHWIPRLNAPASGFDGIRCMTVREIRGIQVGITAPIRD
jgi:hypothetical protein